MNQTEKTNERELLPCPFCAGKADSFSLDGARCLNPKCEAKLPFTKNDDYEKIIMKWNTRTQPTTGGDTLASHQPAQNVLERIIAAGNALRDCGRSDVDITKLEADRMWEEAKAAIATIPQQPSGKDINDLYDKGKIMQNATDVPSSDVVERVQGLHESIGLAYSCISGLGGNRELTYQHPEKANDLDWADRHIAEALDKIERFFA